ncbi:hypothetical protein C2E20_6598 [Micractinium conductrix]|uniref:Uncharacterized protein n=1 Tax=Micractinium conductrix TaxID=554055 RepID=A0A2P6V778_9CHLO|nr:hypothetical protein C2E20_6598 [Micractinium conductrix]|eukprot:PSC69939.1 hypothetical protein C2E20_6598 [Micractinium conductrix]
MQRLGASIARRIARGNPKNSLQQQRGMAGDAHGEVKYNCWEKPTEVAKWKEEHIVFVVLGGWGLGIYSAMKIFGKKEEAPAAA